MNNKMTSGEIAKKAGVSQKAVRLYDEYFDFLHSYPPVCPNGSGRQASFIGR